MTFFYNSTPLNLNIAPLSFRSKPVATPPQILPRQDGFTSNPLYENFGTKYQIEAIAKANPRIVQIMQEHNLPIKANLEELNKLKEGHLKETRIIAAKTYSALPQELKQEVSLTNLQEAAMFHDYGKVLIPDKILNKEGKLNESEREIMELHSELGYELLKDKGFDDKTLKLLKYHHQNPQLTGYPAVGNDFEYGIDLQILNASDKYSALTEKRSYKDAMSKEQALQIIKEDVEKGLLSPEVYQALEKAV